MRIVLIGLLAISISVKAQDPKDIIRKYIDTVSNGNVDNWKKINTVYTESISGYSQDNFTDAKPDFDIMRPYFNKTYAAVPYRQKVETYEDSTCAMLLSKFYFMKDKNVVFVGNLPPMERSVNKSPHEFIPVQFLPVIINNLLKKAKSVNLLGTKEFGNDSITCFEIELRTKDVTEKLYINKRSYFLEYSSIMQDGKYVTLQRYGNYKKFGEVWFPTKEVSTRKDIATGKDVPFFWTHILKLVVNAPIDEKEFTYELKPLR